MGVWGPWLGEPQGELSCESLEYAMQNLYMAPKYLMPDGLLWHSS